MSCGLDDAALNATTAEEPWSANYILAHLRVCADIWGKGIERMLSEEGPSWRYVSPRALIRKTNYPELEFGESLRAFTGQRAELVQRLKRLHQADWSRSATVNGKPETVFSYAQRITSHEAIHLEQIEALLKG